MAFNRQNNSSSVIMGTLSGLVGLVLGLWVFDKVLGVVIPQLETCANASHIWNTFTTCCKTGSNCIGAPNTSLVDYGMFGDAVVFVNDLLPVIGIIGAYLMIKSAIKKMSF